MTAHRVGYRRSLVSQSTSMQFTPSKTIGGRAWISIQLANTRVEKALVIWANTTLGLLLNWWHANKQQSGRGSVGKSSLQYLSIGTINAPFWDICKEDLIAIALMVPYGLTSHTLTTITMSDIMNCWIT